MELLSQRQFAERIGRSHVWVNKLVKAGKIPLVKGKIPLSDGLKAYEASQQLGYEGNREFNKTQRKKSAAAKPKATPKPKARPKAQVEKKEEQQEEYVLPDDDESLPATGVISVDKVADQFNRARMAEKTYQAKLKELDYKEKRGMLITLEAVEADAANIAEELRGLLFAIPPRIAAICEGKQARQIEAIIEDALNDALACLKKSKFGK